MARGRARAHRVGDGERGVRPAVPADPDRGAVGGGPGELAGHLVEQVGAADGHLGVLDPGARPGAGQRDEVGGPRHVDGAARGRGDDGPRDRVLAARLDGGGGPQRLVLGQPAGGRRRRRRVISPVVTVPVLSSTTASMRRVSSSTSAPLIRMPRRAPRPVPTSSAVGVARPSAQGQAMMSTAMATSSARDGSPVASHQPAKVSAASTSTTGTNTADTRSARRCTGALRGLGPLDEPRDAGEHGVGADPGGLDDEPPGGVDRCRR